MEKGSAWFLPQTQQENSHSTPTEDQETGGAISNGKRTRSNLQQP